MSKSGSGLFSGTKGTGSSTRKLTPSEIKHYSHKFVKRWAKQMLSELTGNAKKSFNTACVVYDALNNRWYFGRNGGYRIEGYEKNPFLFGDSIHECILPKKSLNKYPVGNCAEVDAINHALNAGARIENLHLTTIHATKSKFGIYKESCENCRFAFKGRVKANYSGWKDEE